jgi:hypothetical protein
MGDDLGCLFAREDCVLNNTISSGHNLHSSFKKHYTYSCLKKFLSLFQAKSRINHIILNKNKLKLEKIKLIIMTHKLSCIHKDCLFQNSVTVK